ncbi:MAG: hypothetical protein J6D03_00880 [Clostridia bacterium]|nr:hypothetical protein [Clostridia bacterium]
MKNKLDREVLENADTVEPFWGFAVMFKRAKDELAFINFYGSSYFIYDDQKKRDRIYKEMLGTSEGRWGPNDIQLFYSKSKTLNQLCDWVEETFYS